MSDTPALPPDEPKVGVSQRDRPGAAGAEAESPGAPSRGRRTDPLAALRHPGYALFLAGSLVSNTGNQMRTVAVGWEVYERTGTPLSLGLVGLVLALPVLLLALPAGAAADRYARRGLIAIAQAGLAMSGAGLAWASWADAPLAWTYGFLLGTGVFRAVGWPASQAIVTQLVPERDFANAATWRSLAFQVAATGGPLAGGVGLALWGAAPVFALDALSSVVLLACLAFVRPRAQQQSAARRSWAALAEGVRFVRRRPEILSTITLDMVAVLFGGATALLPVYAADVLHVGASGFGWMRAMPALGAMAMGLVLAVRPPIHRAGPAMLAAVAAFGAATVAFGLSRSFGVSLAALFALGAADNVSVVIRATVLQLLTPDVMRGRVAAVNAVFIGTSNEIGELESGVVATLIGPVATVVLGGVATLLTVAAAAAVWPELRRLGALDALRPDLAPAAGNADGPAPGAAGGGHGRRP